MESGKKYPGEGGVPTKAEEDSEPPVKGEKREGRKKSFWSNFAPEVDPNEKKSFFNQSSKRGPQGPEKSVIRKSFSKPIDEGPSGNNLVRRKGC